MLEIKSLITNFCFLSALSLGHIQSANAFALSIANPLYSFGTQIDRDCANNSLTCIGSASGANVGTGISFGDFTAVGLGTASPLDNSNNNRDFGFERGARTTVDSLGFRARGANAFPSGATRDNGKYFSFSATIAPQFALAVSAINFSVSASGSRADFLAFENNDPLPLAVLALNASTEGTYQLPADSFALAPTTFSNTSFTSNRVIEFRIFAYSINAQQGYGVDSVGFNGSVEPIPFEFSPVLGISILAGIYASNKLLKSAKNRKNDTLINLKRS